MDSIELKPNEAAFWGMQGSVSKRFAHIDAGPSPRFHLEIHLYVRVAEQQELVIAQPFAAVAKI
jgi:hypothetical protein